MFFRTINSVVASERNITKCATVGNPTNSYKKCRVVDLFNASGESKREKIGSRVAIPNNSANELRINRKKIKYALLFSAEGISFLTDLNMKIKLLSELI